MATTSRRHGSRSEVAAQAALGVSQRKLEAEARKRILEHANLSLTRSLVEEIVAAVSKGNYPHIAAVAKGVPDRVYYMWFAEGRDVLTRYAEGGDVEFTSRNDPLALRAELYLRVMQAEADWETQTVDRLHNQNQRGEYSRGLLDTLKARVPQRWDRRMAEEANNDTIEAKLRSFQAERAERGRLVSQEATTIIIDGEGLVSEVAE